MALNCVAMTDNPTAHHGQAAIGEEIPLDLVAALGAPQAVPDDPDEVGGDNQPVKPMHVSAKWRPTSQRPSDGQRLEHDGREWCGWMSAIGEVIARHKPTVCQQC